MQTTEATITIRLMNGEALETDNYDYECVRRGLEPDITGIIVVKTTIHGRRYTIPATSICYITQEASPK